MATKALITAEEFSTLDRPDFGDLELVDGEVIAWANANLLRSIIRGRLE